MIRMTKQTPPRLLSHLMAWIECKIYKKNMMILCQVDSIPILKSGKNVRYESFFRFA